MGRYRSRLPRRRRLPRRSAADRGRPDPEPVAVSLVSAATLAPWFFTGPFARRARRQSTWPVLLSQVLGGLEEYSGRDPRRVHLGSA